jgi:hypothetical protein
LLELCDSIRDDALPPLGIRLVDDMKTGECSWKLDDPALLMKEIEQKREVGPCDRILCRMVSIELNSFQ